MTTDEELAWIRRDRDAKLAALGPRPRWWRPFARRRFDRAREAVMAIDVTESALLMRRIYNDDYIKELAAMPHPFFAVFGKDDAP
jgi:hypothetical protein